MADTSDATVTYGPNEVRAYVRPRLLSRLQKREAEGAPQSELLLLVAHLDRVKWEDQEQEVAVTLEQNDALRRALGVTPLDA